MTTTSIIPQFSLQDAGRAVRELRIAADDVKRSEQINKAWLFLNASKWQFDGSALVVESATETSTKRYRVVNGACHCPGFTARSRCWHADAWQILITAMQLAVKISRPQRTAEEVEAAAAELYN